MIVMCEGCETSFNVEDRLIRPNGSKVRCSKCRHVFTAYPPPVEVDDEPLALENEVPSGPRETPAGLPEIDSTLDALFNDAPAAKAPSDQEPELLDVDDLLAEDTPAAAPGGAPEDDLALDLDLGLNLDEPPAAAPTPSAQEDIAIDFNLDLEPPAAAGSKQDALPDLEELEINLDELDQPLAVPPAAAAAETPPSAAAPAPPNELELDLDFDALSETAAAAEAAPVSDAVNESAARPGEDELDLSDLESMLADETATGERVTRAATEGIDLELDLDSQQPPAAPAQPEEMEALDLTSIMPEPEPEPSAPALGLLDEEKTQPTGSAGSDELDFSDLAGILGEPGAEAPKPAAEPVPELDLIFDEAPAQAASAAQPEEQASDDDLMLDLESLLEEGEPGDKASTVAPAESTEELDLDLTGATPAESGDLELEIEPVAEASDLRSSVEPVPTAAPIGVAAAAAAAAVGGAVLAGKGKPAAAGIESGPRAVPELSITEATGLIDNEPETPPAVTKVQPRPMPRESGGLRKVLVGAFAVLVIALLAFGIPRTLGIYVPFLSDADLPVLSELEIPGVGKVFEPVYDDPAGVLKIVPVAETVTAEFVDHPQLGRLCVVRGQLKNTYEHPRNYLQVTSKLYNKNREVTKTATVFAGNVLAGPDLATLDLGAINARLKNRNGANNQNVNVPPGKTVPFMVVFDALPGNLEEYSVEAAGSVKP